VPKKLRKHYGEKIRQLLDNTKNDPTFNWLFQKRKSTQVEAEFGNVEGTVIIDRLFIEGGILWIIDFKTTSLSAEESKKDFSERVKQQHQDQLRHYQSVLESIFQLPSKAAIYCPAIPRLICL